MKIGVFGLWHLGCTILASWAKLGDQIVGYDYEYLTIEKLKKGIVPIYEPGLEDIIKSNPNITFTNNQQDLSDCDFVFLAYDTPIDNYDNSDTTILTKSITDLSKVLKDNAIVIISAQSPIGLCSKLRNILKESNNTLELAYSPENLRLGESINCYLNPDRIILGTNDLNTEKKCIDLFDRFLEPSKILCMSLESAEMVKHGINSFLALSIVFTNNLADICSDNKANINDVIKGIKSDPRIGNKAYLSPGIGFSGGTLGRDLKVLKNFEKDNNYKLFDTIYNSNSDRKNIIVKKIEKSFGKLKNKKIGILGLTYKPGTSTLRRSLPIEISEMLYQKGANILAYDPKADYTDFLNINTFFNISNSINDLIKSVDYVVLMTEWEDFKNYDWSSVKKNMAIFDTKNFLNINNTKIKYFSL